MKISDANALLKYLISLPRETGWLEFKTNKFDHEDVARYVSGLSNAAILKAERRAYLAFGVEDGTHNILGTGIQLKAEKVGNEVFEHWLTRSLDPHLNLEFISIDCGDGKIVELIVIDPAYQRPVRFKKEAFVRIDSVLKPLGDYPEHERSLWLATSSFAFEQGIALHHVSAAEIFDVLDPFALLEMLGHRQLTRKAAIDHLTKLDLLIDDRQGRLDVTNLLALLSAKKLSQIPSVAGKAPRVIEYRRGKKIDAVGDITGQLGYAIGFTKLLQHVMTRMRFESSEPMSNASFRKRLGLSDGQYPQVSIVIREAIEQGWIRPLNEDQSNRNARYVPFYIESSVM
jgi:ATP-dependent DNA helicase RecG